MTIMDSDQTALSIDGMEFTWPGEDHKTLDLKSLDISSGESVLIEGRSGCGKSTLLSLISGIQVVDRGILRVRDQELFNMTAEERDAFRGAHIGYIFQQFNLLPYLSVKENILSPLLFSKTRRGRETGDLDQRVVVLLDHLSLDVDPNKSVRRLSIGQQQRVAVARALIGEPEIIIADEPTSALDSRTREEFIEHLFAEVERLNATLIVVSHDKQLASLFPRVENLEDLNRSGGVSDV
jgi:putative ABC transport system ATP-binding protein